MKNIITNITSYLFPCFYNSTQSINFSTTSLNNVISSNIPITNTNVISKPIVSDFFLFNNPQAYKNMLESYIKQHGIFSDKVKQLILEEQDIADRVYNIHTVTGNNTSCVLLKSLKSKEYLKEVDISSLNTTCGHSSSDSIVSCDTVSLSPGGDVLDITSLPDILSFGGSVFTG